MKRTVPLRDWQVECGKASKDGTLGELMKSLGRGDIVVTDDAGQVLASAPPPTLAQVAPLVELTRDQFGRTKRITPVEQLRDEPRGEIDMDRFRGQMRIAETFSPEEKAKAIKAIYLEHMGIEI